MRLDYKLTNKWLLIVDAVFNLCDDTAGDDIESLTAMNWPTGGEKTTYPYPLAQPDAESCARSLCNGVFRYLGFCRILHLNRCSALVPQLE